MANVPNDSILKENKAILRGELTALRNSVADKHGFSRAICEQAAPLVHGNVMVYVSIGSEVCTEPIFELLSDRSDITLFAPYTDCNGIITPRKISRFAAADKLGNLPESAYAEKSGTTTENISFCITPLLGFNDGGYRIGYGKGCYDKFFKAHCAYKIGLAYSCQRAAFLPEPYDVPLDCCVTEKKVIYF